MRNRSCYQLLFSCLLVTLAAQMPVLGQQRNDDEQSHPQDESGDVASSISVLEQAIGRLETKISQLETKVDRLVDQPSAFSEVQLRVVDQEGQPTSGYEVQLRSSGDVQQATASGVSDDDGLALTRHLPYGSYLLKLNGHGWKTTDVVMIEVGKPLNLTLIAPSPDRLGTLMLQSAVPTNSLEGLRFGGWQLPQGNDSSRWATKMAPEPEGEGDEPDEVAVDIVEGGESSPNPWLTFPTISDGIRTVGLVVELSGSRQIRQDDLGDELWHWDTESAGDNAPHRRWFVRSDGVVQPLLEATEKGTQIGENSGRFAALAEQKSGERQGGSRQQRLGYHLLKLGEEHRGGARLELPAGEIQISIAGIYGQPTDEVRQAIGEAVETAEDGQLWLRAVVDSDSGWLRKILDDTMTHQGHRFTRKVELGPGEKTRVSVGVAE